MGLSHRSEASAWPEPPLPCKAGGGRREARTGSEPGGLECHSRAEAEPRALEAGSSVTAGPDRASVSPFSFSPWQRRGRWPEASRRGGAWERASWKGGEAEDWAGVRSDRCWDRWRRESSWIREWEGAGRRLGRKRGAGRSGGLTHRSSSGGARASRPLEGERLGVWAGHPARPAHQGTGLLDVRVASRWV